MKVVGLMSGTSADAIDAALVEWPESADARPFRLLAYSETPLPTALRARIHRLAAARVPGPEALRELLALDVELGALFADAARRVAESAGLALADVDAIASHGQTVAHHPEVRGSLQIGDPSVLAERTGRTVVADFRARDLAAGGEGAPLAPFFHHAVFAQSGEERAFLNLGGMANLTGLPADGDPAGVIAFDVGPANALLDGAVQCWTDGAETCDRDGAGAAAGRCDAALLARLLADPYLERPPPKSTGREHYGIAEAERLCGDWRRDGGSLPDLLATLVAFSAEAIARACRAFLASGRGLDRLLVGGGGVDNPALMNALRERLAPTRVERCDEHGAPAHAVEAMAFSLLGRNALRRLPNHLPRCTGARAARVLGERVDP